jgi:chromosome segregation ATPase
MMWAEASTIAASQHALIETSWRDEKTHLTEEIAELVRDLDEAARAAVETAQQHETTLTDAQAAAAEQQAAADAARSELAAATNAHQVENANLTTQLAEARATVKTLQEATDALIARIPTQKATTGK